MKRIGRALISVSDKTGIVDLARALRTRGVEIVSTGGTAKSLKDAGIPVVEISAYTGFPEILDGRVKTLHPKVHGGILGRRDDPKHQKEMAENGIGRIDLVVLNLYPFEATVARNDCAFDEAIENIDIGGPAMLRSAAKNHEHVAIVTDPIDYQAVITEMDANGGMLTAETKFRLAKKAFALVARYDCAIVNYLSAFSDTKEKNAWPSDIGFVFEKVQDLRYGENPHQKAAFYRDESLRITNHESRITASIASAKQLQGKELSYNNIMDADAAVEALKEFTAAQYAAVVVKHANPCGVAVSDSSVGDAYEKALLCDPVSAFGGILALTRMVDATAADIIAETFFEVIVAPAFDTEALGVFAKKKNLRLLEVFGLGGPLALRGLSLRKVTGGLLVQERDVSSEDVGKAKVVTKRAPTEEEFEALAFAWRVCKHARSNAIVLASRDRTLGIGAGQTSRVDSAKIAVERMLNVKCSMSNGVIVVASDAFFPFRDGLDIAAKAGAKAAVQPGGSIRDEEVIAAADEHGMAMVFTGVRHFRH